MNPTIHTFSGALVNLNHPKPDQMRIVDIAKGLSNTSRYGGQTRDFYSVAQHSVIITQLTSPQNRLAALLHDAPEAYLGDMVVNVKPFLPDYKAFETKLHDAICFRFGLNLFIPDEVKRLDKLICVDEMAQLSTVNPYPADEPDLGVKIVPWSPAEAFERFMKMFAEIRRTRIAS